jgi:hypothetical protein
MSDICVTEFAQRTMLKSPAMIAGPLQPVEDRQQQLHMIGLAGRARASADAPRRSRTVPDCPTVPPTTCIAARPGPQNAVPATAGSRDRIAGPPTLPPGQRSWCGKASFSVVHPGLVFRQHLLQGDDHRIRCANILGQGGKLGVPEQDVLLVHACSCPDSPGQAVGQQHLPPGQALPSSIETKAAIRRPAKLAKTARTSTATAASPRPTDSESPRGCNHPR